MIRGSPAGQHPLRIVQVSTGDQIGGAEASAYNLFNAYRERGHVSRLVVGFKAGDDPDVIRLPYADPTRQNRWARVWLRLAAPLEAQRKRVPGAVHLYSLVRRVAEPRGWAERQTGLEDFNYPGSWRLLDVVPERPDVVHCHNLHGGYFDLRVLPWLSQQVPVVLNLHDAWPLSGHCAYFFDCERWRTGCGQCPDLTIYPAIPRDATAENWRRKRDIYAQSRLYITTPSRWLMDKVRASMLRDAQYKVIGNAIDLTVFRPGDRQGARRTLGWPPEARIILLTAHNPFKDYATMEAALARLNVDADTELMFVCLGNARARPDRALGRGRMSFPAFERDARKVAQFYQAADVFVHAAHDETYGLMVAEAMACGTPVVATAVGGIIEQIDDGRTGFLVPKGDAAAMAARITALLNDESLHARIGRHAGQVARQHCDLNRQVDEFLGWYGEVIDDWQAWQRAGRPAAAPS